MSRSLTRSIAESVLADYIDNEAIRPGERLPVVSELAKQYGASRATVVQALAVLQEQGRVQTRRGSGCYVIEHFEDLRRAKSSLLGLVTIAPGSELIMDVQAGIERICARSGFHLIVCGTPGDYESEREQVARAVDAGCQAIVLVPVGRTRRQLRADYLRREFQDVPMVLLDIAYPEQGRTQVVFDNHRAGLQMTRALIAEGHRRIAFMDFDLGEEGLMHFSTRERHRGYLDALRDAGIAPVRTDQWLVSRTWPGPDMTSCVAPFLQTWAQQSDRPTAVMATEDFTAMQTIMLAQRLGIRVPDDLRVTGFDNVRAARSFYPPFPTSAPDFEAAGELAADLAVRQIGAPSTDTVVYVLPLPVLSRQLAPLPEWTCEDARAVETPMAAGRT